VPIIILKQVSGGRLLTQFIENMPVEFNMGGAGSLRAAKLPAQEWNPAAAGTSCAAHPGSARERISHQPAPVRPDKIMRAAALLSDQDYPSDAALSRLAALLARRL
jgi:hypothetical protein